MNVTVGRMTVGAAPPAYSPETVMTYRHINHDLNRETVMYLRWDRENLETSVAFGNSGWHGSWHLELSGYMLRVEFNCRGEGEGRQLKTSRFWRDRPGSHSWHGWDCHSSAVALHFVDCHVLNENREWERRPLGGVLPGF